MNHLGYTKSALSFMGLVHWACPFSLLFALPQGGFRRQFLSLIPGEAGNNGFRNLLGVQYIAPFRAVFSAGIPLFVLIVLRDLAYVKHTEQTHFVYFT